MKLERNRAERRSKHGAQILFNGIPYLIFAALAAGFLLGAPQMIAASSIAQAAKSTVTVTERKAFPFAFAGYLGKTNSVISRGFTQEDFTYSGSFVWVDDGNGDFRFKALTSGTFTPLKKIAIDVFIVGGGGGGRNAGANQYPGGGGAGGLTGTWFNITLSANTTYTITVGAGGAANGGTGGTTSISGGDIPTMSKSGGVPNPDSYARGGNGGSGGGGGLDGGGNGGSDGSDGTGGAVLGQGQHSTTREFGEAGAALYAGGGGNGGGRYSYSADCGLGGAGGGGRGGLRVGGNGVAGTANTGGGGGGGGTDDDASVGSGAAGGSGILIIRNKR